jgi:hypothetical protein
MKIINQMIKHKIKNKIINKKVMLNKICDIYNVKIYIYFF